MCRGLAGIPRLDRGRARSLQLPLRTCRRDAASGRGRSPRPIEPRHAPRGIPRRTRRGRRGRRPRAFRSRPLPGRSRHLDPAVPRVGSRPCPVARRTDRGSGDPHAPALLPAGLQRLARVPPGFALVPEQRTHRALRASGGLRAVVRARRRRCAPARNDAPARWTSGRPRFTLLRGTDGYVRGRRHARARGGAMSTQDLRRLDPQLAYLALLTLAQLKPLSRWECALTETEIDVLRATVPHVRRIRRRTRLGRPVTETLIANDPARAVLYERIFGGRRLRRTPETVRREGRLLGYPSCCVEGFVREPYAANGMAPDDQEILFHWACPGCRVTPTLLREYRQVHADCSRLFRRVRTSDASPRWLDRAGHVAATVALVAGASGATTTDPHRLPAPDDLDGDHASVAEEILAGTDWERRDTDDDTVVDGVQIAQLLDALVESPPPGVMVTHHPQRGMETCPHCGATVN